jgi:hypothetical protein
MSSPKDEEKPHDETRDHGDGDNDEVRQPSPADGPAAAPWHRKRPKKEMKRGG